jgi:membrane fusion protein, multidrug efflux system
MKVWTYRGWVILAIVAGVVGGGIYFLRSLSYESTDDAYVAGTIIPIAAEVRGRVVKVHVQDNQSVTAGMPLFEIYQQDYVNHAQEKTGAVDRLKAEERELRASVEQKEKAVVQSRADLNAVLVQEELAAKEQKRYERLIQQGTVSQSHYDRIESQWKVLQARKEAAAAALAEASAAVHTLRTKLATQTHKIAEARASRDLAERDLSRTVVIAPASGRIAKKNVDPGKYVQVGQTLLAIVADHTWVVANFKETQIKKMTAGQPVEIEVDAYPGKAFKGRIDSLQPGTGAVFSLLPPENATGNFVKVVQRVPVKIIMDSPPEPAYPLWPGLSVIPTVDISKRTGEKLTPK